MSEVRFCENNFGHGTDDVAERIESEFEDVAVIIEPCLTYCGECAAGPFAVVNDELIQADSSEELYDIIVEKLQ